MPAAIPTTAPFTSDVTFSITSAFASSISSRTSRVAFSETSPTISPSDFSALPGGGVPLPLVTTEPLQYLREHHAAHEGARHEQLGPVGGRSVCELGRPGRRVAALVGAQRAVGRRR